MLRMGRSPRVEQNESERPAAAGEPQQAANLNQQPAQSFQASQQERHAPPVRPEVATPSTPRAVSETETLARELKEGIMSGFVGSSTVLTGDAEFKGMLRIDGRLTGRISSEKGTLIVSAGGVVEANISVGTARVNGTVHGDIVAAERIELGRSARIIGNIQTPVLVVEQGAIFEGGCRMTQAKPETIRPQTHAPEKTSAARPSTPAKPRPAQAPTASQERVSAPPSTAEVVNGNGAGSQAG